MPGPTHRDRDPMARPWLRTTRRCARRLSRSARQRPAVIRACARALLMRRGMVAWMRSVADGAGRAAIPRPTRSAAALPALVHQPAIDILATMVLASAREKAT